MASIYCDGACRGNGTARAIAGWAWGYWPGPAAGSPDRFGAGRPAGAATNQRAELTALLEALQWWSGAGAGGDVTIYTDSMYAINCTTKWGPAWRKKGWKRDSGEPLQNLDLIRPLVELWKPAWRLKHVRGHQKAATAEAYGNNWVDHAAVLASQDELKTGTVLPPSVLPPSVTHPSAPVVVHSRPPATSTVYKHQTDLRQWFGAAR